MVLALIPGDKLGAEAFNFGSGMGNGGHKGAPPASVLRSVRWGKESQEAFRAHRSVAETALRFSSRRRVEKAD